MNDQDGYGNYQGGYGNYQGIKFLNRLLHYYCQ